MNHEFDMCPDNNRNNGNRERLKQHKQDSETERVQQGKPIEYYCYGKRGHRSQDSPDKGSISCNE